MALKTKKGLAFLFLFGAGIIAVTYLVVNSRQETRELDDAVRKEAPGKFLELQHGFTHYKIIGSDTGRLLLLIPGGGISGIESYEKCVPYFVEKGYRVLAYDLYGRGYSDRPDVPHTAELFLEQLTSLLNALAITDTIDVISMSLGSAIALDFASRYPEQVKKVILIDPVVTGDFKINTLLKIPVVSDFLMTVYWYPRAAENQRKEFVNNKVFDRYKTRLEYFMDFKGYKHTNYSTWENILTQNKLTLLEKIPPDRVLLLYGNKDPYFSKELADRFNMEYPSLIKDSIAEAGHIPHLEKPLVVSMKVHEFLSK